MYTFITDTQFYNLNRKTKKLVRSFMSDAALYTSYSFAPHLTDQYKLIISGKGCYLYTQDKRKILDGCSGAAVSCLGHSNKKLEKAIKKILKTGTPYLASTF